MSRIPPPKSKILKPTASEDQDSSSFKKPAAFIPKLGVKRPADHQSQPHVSEKRLKSSTNATLTRSASTLGSASLQKGAGFSERAKRSALQPIAENKLIRGSMPALNRLPPKAKRPAWDLKGRIQDMEENFQNAQLTNATLSDQLTRYNERIAALEEANTALNKDIHIKETLSEEATSQVHELERRLRDNAENYEKTLNERETEIFKLKQESDHLKMTVQNLIDENSSLKSNIKSLVFSKSGLEAQLSATEALVENLKGDIQRVTNAKLSAENKCESLTEHVACLESKLINEETTRRKLHNLVQELKGNIRVYCRIRPPLPEELRNGMQVADMTTDKKTIGLNDNNKPAKKFDFTFDSVFPSTASQAEVFDEISQLVQSSIDGYNVCIFAYGQTGSGKTYTMEGPENIVDFQILENESQLGMIPRSVNQIFTHIEKLKSQSWTYRVEALFLEIYKEKIQDLLSSSSQSGHVKCEIIKSAAKGNDCLLSNVTASPVTCAEEVFILLKKARINRAVAATKCNEYSSRSHYVFQLKIYGENGMTGEKCDGILNLVDLAGSERVKDSCSEGERLTEAKAINKSLANLGNVIMSLAKKDSHVPFRDSKLTHLLANSLGGNSKTLMFVNISPDRENVNETINSLRFATKVNQCNIGTAQKRVK